MAEKLTRLTNEIAIQLNLMAESCTICSSRARQLVRKRLDTPSYRLEMMAYLHSKITYQQRPLQALLVTNYSLSLYHVFVSTGMHLHIHESVIHTNKRYQ